MGRLTTGSAVLQLLVFFFFSNVPTNIDFSESSDSCSMYSVQVLQLYSVDPEVIRYGMLRMSIICTTYCLCGMMDVMVGALRGIGSSVMPMLVTLTGVCVFRVVWIFTVFAAYRSLEVLYISYPISWAVTILVHTSCFIYVYHKTMMGRDE